MRKLCYMLAAAALMALAAVFGGGSGLPVIDPLKDMDQWSLTAMPLAVGMIINQNTLAGIYRDFTTIFNKFLATTETYYQKVAMVIPSTSKEMSYNWLGAFPKMREWVGDRVVKDLTAFNYSITNKDWETTVEVDRNDIKDDNLGIYAPMVEGMGASAAAHPDELIFETLMPGGFSELCYDGQFFFDTDHPVGTGVVSNFGGGSGTAWYLLDTTKPVKPFIFQSRENPVFTAMDKPDNENVFMRRKYVYGADRRDNAGYGLWQCAYGSKDTLNNTNFAAARAAMMAFKDDEGKPLGIKPNLLVIPGSLEEAARKILVGGAAKTTEDTPWIGTCDILVVPRLS